MNYKTTLSLTLTFLFILVGCGVNCETDRYNSQCFDTEITTVKSIDILVSLDKMDDTNSTKLKAALQEIDNKIHSTYSSFDVKMALVASRTIGASSYKTGFLSNIIESNSYNYPSLIEQAFTNLGKIKFSETASPLGILELALRVNPSFLRKNSSTLFVVVTERDEPNGQFFDIESRLRAFTEGRHSLLLVTKEALTYVNYIATNKNAHRVPLEAATSDSLSQAIWGEVNYLRQDEFKEDSASDGTLIEY